MKVGLRTWDSTGKALMSLTDRYIKIVGSRDIPATQDTTDTINYTVPAGAERLAIATYKGDSSRTKANGTTESVDKDAEDNLFVKDCWDIGFTYSNTGVTYTAKANAGESRIPLTIYYGYY